MPSVTLRLSSLRPPVWKRPSTIGAVAIALGALPLLLAAWMTLGPERPLPDADAPTPAGTVALRAFERDRLGDDAYASIARGNVLSATRSEFTRPEASAAVQAPTQDTGASAAMKRLESAKRDLATLRMVAVLRVGGEWIALFEPATRAAHEDLLSLRVGDVWQEWSVAAITRDTVRVGFEGHTETINLRPHAGRTTRAPGAAPPRGRIQAESRPTGGSPGSPVRVDPPLPRSEARERLLDSARGESPRVRALAEELLKSLDREKNR